MKIALTALVLLSVIIGVFQAFESPHLELLEDVPGYLSPKIDYPKTLFYPGSSFSATAENISGLGAILKVELRGQNPATSPIELIPTRILFKKNKVAIKLMLPADTTAGSYLLVVTFENGQLESKLRVQPGQSGLTNIEVKNIVEGEVRTQANGPLSVSFQGTICDNCIYEFVMTGDPKKPGNLAFVSNRSVWKSSNGGRAWSSDLFDSIDTFAAPYQDYSGMTYYCDPKLIPNSSGGFYALGMFMQRSPLVSGGGVLYKLNDYNPGTSAAVTIVQGRVANEDYNSTLVFDYPKMAYDETRSRIFVGANAVYHESTDSRFSGLYVSQNNGQSFQKHYLDSGYPFTSMAVSNSDGTLYGVHYSYAEGTQLLGSGLFKYPGGTNLDNPLKLTIPGPKMWTAGNTHSTTSPRKNFTFYPGPEIKIDNSNDSPTKNRIYVLWAEPLELRAGAGEDFNGSPYGYNYSIKISWSDDSGANWTLPKKVHPDAAGDRGFPSMSIDKYGHLHIAYVHSYLMNDTNVLDTYYTVSTDRGQTFAEPIRVSKTPVVNPAMQDQTRPIGDYLDMVVGYPGLAYVAHPCPATSGRGVCIAEVNFLVAMPTPGTGGTPTPPPVAIDPPGLQTQPAVVAKPKMSGSFGSCSLSK